VRESTVFLFFYSKENNKLGREIDDEVTFKINPDESLAVFYAPYSEKSFCKSFVDESFVLESKPVEKLNPYLASRDISPIRQTLTIPWKEASERTKRLYVHKG
jgi:hypothetical protein